ncbi:MAG: hypothetical protein U1E57_06550 [Paenacidovorax caeni]
MKNSSQNTSPAGRVSSGWAGWIFDVKGGFMAGLVSAIPYPLVAFFLYALIKNDIRRFVAEVRACGTPKYQLYRNNTGIAVTGNGRLILSVGPKTKSYDFSAVRQWRTSLQAPGVAFMGLTGAMVNMVEMNRAAQNTGILSHGERHRKP